MKNLAKWMLGAVVVAGGLGLGATKAQAAEVRVVVGGPAVYMPPCPGPGYFWVAGYYANGYWVPGRWSFGGVRAVGPAPVVRFDRHYDVRRDYDRRYDRDHFRR